MADPISNTINKMPNVGFMLNPQNKIMSQTKNNPYQNLDPTTTLSMWNKFTDSLGITNHAGQLQYQHGLLSNQWESENALKQADLEYNSPEQQANRMRAAGLNPDLLGVGNYEGVTSGNQASSPEALNPISQALQTAGNSFTNVLSNVFAGLTTFIQVKRGLLDIDAQQIANDISVDNAVEQIGNRILRDTPFEEGKSSFDIRPSVKTYSARYNKRVQKAVDDWLVNNYGSTRHKAMHYGDEALAAENRNKALYEKGDTFTYNNDDAQAAKVIHQVNKFAYDSYMINQDFSNKLAKYNIADLDDRSMRKLYQSNNEVQELVNNFNKNIKKRTNRFLEEVLNDRGFFATIIAYQILAGQTGSTDLIAAGVRGLSNIGAALGYGFARRGAVGAAGSRGSLAPMSPTANGSNPWFYE